MLGKHYDLIACAQIIDAGCAPAKRGLTRVPSDCARLVDSTYPGNGAPNAEIDVLVIRFEARVQHPDPLEHGFSEERCCHWCESYAPNFRPNRPIGFQVTASPGVSRARNQVEAAIEAVRAVLQELSDSERSIFCFRSGQKRLQPNVFENDVVVDNENP